jgi:hypothetical protein
MKIFPLSARTGEGCDLLKNALLWHFAGEYEATITIPYDDGATLAALLGVSESPADGASVTFSVAEGHIASLLIVYQTDAGNTVTVTLAFSY